MAPDERLTELAGAVADGHPLDWDAAARGADTPDERAAVAALRDLALVGGLFAGTTSDGRGAWRDRTPLVPGTTWGTLRIDAHVGRGRFGDVYRAWDPALHRVVALKLVAADDAGASVDTEVIEEGRLMARVRHPNVVAIHGAQRIGDVTGLSMEYIEGRTLEDELLERGRFRAAEMTSVAEALCGALAAVHAAGLVHRDVKATNVIRETGGRLVLGDFGTGLAVDAMPDLRVGLVGTPVYIAPEIFQRGSATQKSDLYSLGVLLFHLATSRFPVPGRSMVELRAAHEGAQRPALATLRPDLPQGLRSGIERLLDPDPDRRFDSAEAARQALVPSTVSRRRVAAIAALAAVTTVSVASWGWWAWTRGAGGSQGSPLQQPTGEAAGDQVRVPPSEPPSPVATAAGHRQPQPTNLVGDGRVQSSPAVIQLNPGLQSIAGLTGVASDRHLMACRDSRTGAVSICNLATGEIRAVLPQSGQMVPILGRHSRLLSPDGTRIAGRFNQGPRGQQQAIVYVVGTDGQPPITLLRTEADADPALHRWLADGSALVVSERVADGHRAFLLPVDGTAQTELYRLSPEYSGSFDLSPDGRFLAATRGAGNGDRELVVIERSTGAEARLTSLMGWGWPLWTPDGRAIVFTITRGNSSQLMRLPMSDGTAAGPPELVWRFARTEARLTGFGADGSLYTNNRGALRTAYVTSIDLARSTVGPAKLVDPGDAEDTIGADWSPDGIRVAYLRGLLGHPGGPHGTLVIREIGGPIVSEIPLPGWLPESATQVRWSPDGRRLAVAYGGEVPKAMAIDVIDLETSKHQRVVSGVPFESPRWDPSGEWLYYQEAATIVRYNLATGDRQPVYQSKGFGIQRNAGFDVSKTDGALALPVVRPGIQGCVVRIVGPADSIVDRHAFADDCRAVAWSRDGTALLVSTVPDAGPPSLWRLNRAAGEPVRLPIEAPVFHDLSLSPANGPAGMRLLFSAGNPTWSVVMVTGIHGARR
jgi:serine/threonine protein kinase/Tol biopolymer transport system component